ncbi:MAG: hypothetical protein PHX62_03345 [Bacilli bacterium]|nr:hypothetical protein [Bacilli bacterium]
MNNCLLELYVSSSKFSKDNNRYNKDYSSRELYNSHKNYNRGILNLLGDRFNVLKIKSIDFEGLHLKAINPLSVSFKDEEDLVISKCNELDISSFGDDCTDAKENLFEKIAFMWREYALALDDVLSRDAIKIKKELLKHFKEI